MQPFRSVLFAADFSDNSKEAFCVACSLAVEMKTRLTVLHVLEPKWIAHEPVSSGEATVRLKATPRDEDRHDLFKRYLCETYPSAGPLDVHYCTSEGDVSAEILRFAGEIGSDLIVMGTHGRTGIRRLLAGSVATAVLRGAHCAVLALRSGEVPRKVKEIRVILHPTDFSDSSESAAEVARSLAHEVQACLILFYVEPLEVFMDGTRASVIDPRICRDGLEALRKRMDGSDLECPVATRIGEGFAPDAIVKTAEEVGCDLIVMGTHGRTGLGRVLMGSVAESVLSRAKCPVLVVKADQRAPAPPADRTAEQLTTVLGSSHGTST